MRIVRIELHVIEMALKTPFVTSLGTVRNRSGIIIEATDENGVTGYGEAVAFSTPWYTEETTQTCFHLLKDILAPLVINHQFTRPEELHKRMAEIRKNPMAKAAIDMAVWDLYAKTLNKPLHLVIGGTRKTVLAGISIGASTVEQLLEQTNAALKDGYSRIKIKIAPGRDLDRIRAIREAFPELSVLADANSAYIDHEKELSALDDYGLQMIEQPLSQDDFIDHAGLQKRLKTPICLDESITSFHSAKTAVELKSCRVINLKIGRVGGLTEAIKIHDLCLEHGIQVWCGGMLEFGISRAHNVALATLEGFTIPGDISSSERYWEEDITLPDVKVKDGVITPFKGPGIGVSLNRKRLEQVRKHYELLE
ncbi:o-succinylbenzoate synthase [Jeotgalibacillus proteolyticus]|uniref:o-succinylbenzoate synthase n=1 Tax=Jeotgalibacillus proteolyticus TaxID=2082395 RepID=A0A2S5GFE4_9BACL|nr:o-succinylbenzoate synthase [Jeotgalibacillus proteolyticus]PPA71750.1 o-succinylbenzoate synthase [Jeotgalibacillus proteolyticus]